MCDPALISNQLLTEAGLGSAVLSKDISLLDSCAEPSERHVLVASRETADLVEIIEKSKDFIDLILLPGYASFVNLLELLYANCEAPYGGAKLPDIAVFTDDCTIFNRAWWHNRSACEPLMGKSIVCIATKIIYFSHGRPIIPADDALSNGSLIAVHCDGEIRFVVQGQFGTFARTASTIPILRSLLSKVHEELTAKDMRLADRYYVVVQHDDIAFHDLRSVAYGKRHGVAPKVRLIPDPFFFESRGYKEVRQAVFKNSLPDWNDRANIVFWRGSATHNGLSLNGERIEDFAQVPRVMMCAALRGQKGIDAAVAAPWGWLPDEWGQPHEDWQRIVDAGLHRPMIPMIDHAKYRYLIDIDGVSNAWSFFEKLLLGSCILKVSSPFEQWFYSRLREWEHFVPVRGDLSDLIDKIAWCREHEAEARAIAEAGQRFALGMTYDVGRELAEQSIRDCLMPFGQWPTHKNA